MQYLLPLAILAVVAVLVLFVAPWSRIDPKQGFMFEMCKRLAKAASEHPDADGVEDPSSEEIHDL